MRAIMMLAAASLLFGTGAAVGQELISKEEIKATLLGPTRAIGKKQRTAVDLPTVTFDFNSAALTRQGEQQLDILASVVKEIGLAQEVLTIEGHTDASGSESLQSEPLRASRRLGQGLPGQPRRSRPGAPQHHRLRQVAAAARQAGARTGAAADRGRGGDGGVGASARSAKDL